MDMLKRAHPMAWVATNQAPPLYMHTQVSLGSKPRLYSVLWDGLEGQSALEGMQGLLYFSSPGHQQMH